MYTYKNSFWRGTNKQMMGGGFLGRNSGSTNNRVGSSPSPDGLRRWQGPLQCRRWPKMSPSLYHSSTISGRWPWKSLEFSLRIVLNTHWCHHSVIESGYISLEAIEKPIFFLKIPWQVCGRLCPVKNFESVGNLQKELQSVLGVHEQDLFQPWVIIFAVELWCDSSCFNVRTLSSVTALGRGTLAQLLWHCQ